MTHLSTLFKVLRTFGELIENVVLYQFTERRPLERAWRMRKPRTVLLVMVCVKYNYENCAREVLQLSRRLQGLPFRPAMHSKRQIAYVVETELTSMGLMDRLGETTKAGCIERVWVFTPGQDVVSDLSPDPLAEYIKSAWANVRKWNNPQNMRPPKAREIFVKRGIKDSESGAAVKMGFKPRGMGKRPQDSN